MSQNVHEFRSETSTTVLYACGTCRYTALDRGHAEACCVCPKCGEPSKGPGAQACEDCRSAIWREKALARRAKALAAPIVEDKGEPVYTDDDGHFYEDAAAAAEALWDCGKDPTAALVNPCTVTKVATPNIAEWIEEAWAEQFEDPDDVSLSKRAVRACEALQRILEKEAPTSWVPRTDERIMLPVVGEEGVKGEGDG